MSVEVWQQCQGKAGTLRGQGAGGRVRGDLGHPDEHGSTGSGPGTREAMGRGLS